MSPISFRGVAAASYQECEVMLWGWVVKKIVIVCVCGVDGPLSTGHPNKCWDQKRGLAYAIDEEWQSTNCGTNTCTRIDDSLYVQWAT